MARLRHIAVVVKDLEKSARFYEDVFEMKQVGREDLDWAVARIQEALKEYGPVYERAA